METAEIGQIALFLLLVSVPLICIDLGMRRVKRRREGRWRPSEQRRR